MYLAVADFRSGTQRDFTKDLEPVSTTDASDVQLTDAIVRMGNRFDRFAGDHFEPESLVLELAGSGTDSMLLPRRIRTITQIETRLVPTSAYTVQAVGLYRAVSSLSADGLQVLGDVDKLWLLNQLVGADGSSAVWPRGAGRVKITGTFGWAAPPADVKRAVALMVWDHFIPINADLRRVDRWGLPDGTFYSNTKSEPTGLPEVDDIIEGYRRPGIDVFSVPIEAG